MIKNKIKAKLLTGIMSAALIVGLCPASAFAVTGDAVAQDGTYTSDFIDAVTNRTDWDTYGVKAEVTVTDGKIADINVTTDDRYDRANSIYLNTAKSGLDDLKGIDATETAVGNVAEPDTVSGATITFNSIKTAVVNALNKADEKAEEFEYVMMNIPYSDFYENEINSDGTEVDGVSSATLNKTRTTGLVAGSYHVDSKGSDITGVTFPVKLGEGVDSSALKDYVRVKDSDSVTIEVTNRGQTSKTTYQGQDALFENASYAYYVLSEAPSYYKELTIENGVPVFSEIKGDIAVNNLENISADFKTESSYGDYELMLFDENDMALTSDTIKGTIYGVVVSTTDGTDYGMRHLENIWRVYDLAWCTGFTTLVHNCPTSSAHYESMMGKTINKVTYYTSEGIYEIPLEDEYVPFKFNNTVDVEDALVKDGETTATVEGLPSDYNAEYAVKDLEGAAVSANADGTVTITWDAEKASKKEYTLTIKDANEKYAGLSTSFTLSTDLEPAAYNGDKNAPALVKSENEGVTDNDFADYLKNIASVKVGENVYAASGRGAVQIINEDGTINTEATNRDAAIFEAGQTYEITVTAQTYAKDLTFEYTAPTDTTALEAAIADAEDLNKSDYTAESWEMLQGVIAAAKVTLNSDPTQVAADEAVEAINNAITALEKPATDPSDEDTPNDDGTVGGDNNNGGDANNDGNVNNDGNTNGEATSTDNGAAAATDSAAQTGDDTALMGLIALAVASLGGAGFAVTRRRKAGENK